MTENKPEKSAGQAQEDQNDSGSGSGFHSRNLVTPVAVHENWEEAYIQEERQDEKLLDYKAIGNGRVAISKKNLEMIKEKLEAAKRVKRRQVKILKRHEELIEERDRLLERLEASPEAGTDASEPLAESDGERILKATRRVRKITQAMAACSWHQGKRKAMLTREMIKTLKYIDKTVKKKGVR